LNKSITPNTGRGPRNDSEFTAFQAATQRETDDPIDLGGLRPDALYAPILLSPPRRREEQHGSRSPKDKIIDTQTKISVASSALVYELRLVALSLLLLSSLAARDSSVYLDIWKRLR
jgi:hypothetical protein